VRIDDRLSLALCSAEEAKILHRSRSRNMYFICLDTYFSTGGCFFNPPQLSDIYRFTIKIQTTLRRQDKCIVACASKHNSQLITNTCLLFGAFLILGKGMNSEEVTAAFHPLESFFICFPDPSRTDNTGSVTIFDCWSALSHVRSLGWIQLPRVDGLGESQEDLNHLIGKLDMEEFMHYAEPVNGNLRTVLPGKLIYFSTPVDLPDNRQWMDVGHVRQFSAAFYADLHTEFGVALVISLEECRYDATPFAQAGIGVEEMHVRRDGSDALRAADRFLSLLAAAPGAVAVHGGEDGLLLAGTLVAAHMIARLGFGAGAAVAWVRMVCPALAVPRRHLDALAEEAAALRLGPSSELPAGLFARCFSAPEVDRPLSPGGRNARAAGSLLRLTSLPDVIL
jgi:hypothetical protein